MNTSKHETVRFVWMSGRFRADCGGIYWPGNGIATEAGGAKSPLAGGLSQHVSRMRCSA